LEKLKTLIENDTECKAAFLRGFFDSEGCVSKFGAVIVYNTDLILVEYVKQLLSSLGIETTGPRLYLKSGTAFRDLRTRKTYKSKKDAYELYVTADSLQTFYRLIGFTVRRKQQRLVDYLVRTGRLKPPANPPPHLSPTMLSYLDHHTIII